ncbi:MAG: excinuclease ABC subunit UvrA, partial [Rhodothermaceae bacterium]|nr:excinuclease ABC subunit UvrA [Rhodothermaceae bacterium]
MEGQNRERQDESILVRGAREHNLRDVDVDVPRDELVVVTGLSGSGKSSLAFDTVYAEGQRRYLESLSAYARQFVGMPERPDVDHIEGLSPVIAIDQKTVSRSSRSTVGTVTEIYDFLRLLYARAATSFSAASGKPLIRQSTGEIIAA